MISNLSYLSLIAVIFFLVCAAATGFATYSAVRSKNIGWAIFCGVVTIILCFYSFLIVRV